MVKGRVIVSIFVILSLVTTYVNGIEDTIYSPVVGFTIHELTDEGDLKFHSTSPCQFFSADGSLLNESEIDFSMIAVHLSIDGYGEVFLFTYDDLSKNFTYNGEYENLRGKTFTFSYSGESFMIFPVIDMMINGTLTSMHGLTDPSEEPWNSEFGFAVIGENEGIVTEDDPCICQGPKV